MRPVPELDLARLGPWLEAQAGESFELEASALKGGGSCEIFSLRAGDHHWVLRRAPAHASSSTAHDVLREFRILDAIQNENVRISRPLFACEDPSVANGAFYIMEFVDGEPIRRGLPAAYADSVAAQRVAVMDLIDCLAEIHTVDWQRVGLQSLGNPDGYLERQVPRWMAQLDSYRCRDLPRVDQVAAWLRDHRPAEQPPCLVHGDYKLDNVLYRRVLPARALAVVDWEMASVGDPLVDLAWALIFCPEEGNVLALGAAGQPGGFLVDAVPTHDELIQRYVEATGRDVSALDWYRVFSRWKLGIVLEGSYAKHLRGESTNPNHAFFGGLTDTLLEQAREIVARA